MAEAADILTAIGAQLQRVADLDEAARALGAELATLRGTAESDDGEVAVTVDHHGIVADLALSDEALLLGPQRLSALVVETTGRAIEALQHQADELHERLLPASALAGFDDSYGDRIEALFQRVRERQHAGESENGAGT